MGKPFRLDELRARAAKLAALKQVHAEPGGQPAGQMTGLAELAFGLRARAASAEADRLSPSKIDFVHLVAHELGSPLTALRLQVGRLACRAPKLPKRRRPRVARLGVSARRVSDLAASPLQLNCHIKRCRGAE